MWYAATAGCTGFATNLGGLVTLPVALPANLASVSLMQLRMVVQIAQQRGYQPADERVRTVAFLCLLGAAGASALEEFGVKLGTQLTARLIMQISGATLTRINQAVGFRLMTKAGTTGLVNLTRIVPFIGGIVGGGVDLALTLGVAEAAKAAFPRLEDPDPQAAGSG